MSEEYEFETNIAENEAFGDFKTHISKDDECKKSPLCAHTVNDP